MIGDMAQPDGLLVEQPQVAGEGFEPVAEHARQLARRFRRIA